jgi:hypothetical protein
VLHSRTTSPVQVRRPSDDTQLQDHVLNGGNSTAQMPLRQWLSEMYGPVRVEGGTDVEFPAVTPDSTAWRITAFASSLPSRPLTERSIAPRPILVIERSVPGNVVDGRGIAMLSSQESQAQE